METSFLNLDESPILHTSDPMDETDLSNEVIEISHHAFSLQDDTADDNINDSHTNKTICLPNDPIPKRKVFDTDEMLLPTPEKIIFPDPVQVASAYTFDKQIVLPLRAKNVKILPLADFKNCQNFEGWSHIEENA